VAPPLDQGDPIEHATGEDRRIDKERPAMPITVAANDSFVLPTSDPVHQDALGMELPEDHRGPVMLSDTGRMVWWTGRVAIGLRYEPPPRCQTIGQSALWVQDLLLKCG
jgi:hypothetical protein